MIADDILRIFPSLISRGNFFIYTNLPYNISSVFTGSLIDMVDFSGDSSGLNGAIVMYQKEFGERLIAPDSTKKYGKISVTFQNTMIWKKIIDVPKSKFIPQPKVDSIVIMMRPKNEWNNIPEDPDLYRKLIDRCFSSRRKKLKNLVKPGSLSPNLLESDINALLTKKGWKDLRPENLTPNDFIALANSITDLMKYD